MSLGSALARDLASLLGMALVLALLLIGGAFCLGWWLGDRYDLPRVHIEAA